MRFCRLFLLSCLTALVIDAQQPEELWKTSFPIGSLTTSFVLVADRLLAFPRNPGSIHSFNISNGDLLSSQLIPDAPDTFDGAYRVNQATPIPNSTDVLLTIGGSLCDGGGSCPTRLWRYDTVNFEASWENIYPSDEPSPIGTAAISSNGSIIAQTYSSPNSFRALDAGTGETVWTTPTDLIFRGGGTMIDDTKVVFGSLGGRLTVLSVEDGTVIEEYTPATPCGVDEPLLNSTNNTDPAQTCNNLFHRPLVSNGGDFVYIVDDLHGLSKFDSNNVASGPIWTTAFASTSSQQSSLTPAISSDDSVIYATAYQQVAAVRADDGETIWVDDLAQTTAQGDVTLTSEDEVLVLTTSGRTSQANRALSGGRAWRISDANALETDGSIVFRAAESFASALDPFIPTPFPTESTVPTQPPPSQSPSTTPSMTVPTVVPTPLPTDTLPSESPSTSPSNIPSTTMPIAPPTSSPVTSAGISSNRSVFYASLVVFSAIIWFR